MAMTLKDVIINGPNRFTRILGHATVDGLPVRLSMRFVGFGIVVVEYTDATRENDGRHQLGGNYSPEMAFTAMLATLPRIARFEPTPAIVDALGFHLSLAPRAACSSGRAI